jgi:hypothetical protein
VGCTGVNEDCVGRPGVEVSAVTGNYLHIAQVAQIASGTGSELWVNLDRSDMAIAAYNFRQDCRVITGPATNVDHMLSFFQLKRVNEESQKARLPVVKVPLRIDPNEDIVIDVPRIGIRSHAV